MSRERLGKVVYYLSSISRSVLVTAHARKLRWLDGKREKLIRLIAICVHGGGFSPASFEIDISKQSKFRMISIQSHKAFSFIYPLAASFVGPHAYVCTTLPPQLFNILHFYHWHDNAIISCLFLFLYISRQEWLLSRGRLPRAISMWSNCFSSTELMLDVKTSWWVWKSFGHPSESAGPRLFLVF